jgi:hypothetical protein
VTPASTPPKDSGDREQQLVRLKVNIVVGKELLKSGSVLPKRQLPPKLCRKKFVEVVLP